MKVTFSIPSAKPESKPESANILDDSPTTATATENDSDETKHSITEFDPRKPATPSAPKITIPPIQNQWKPQQDQERSTARWWCRTPAETELLRRLKLEDDLQRLPEDQGFDEFKDFPVEGFGAALLAGYGWAEGMGIGKNAKEDVKVPQIKRRTAGEGLGFVPIPSTHHL